MSLDESGKVASKPASASAPVSDELRSAINEIGNKTSAAIEANAKIFAEALKRLPTGTTAKPVLKWVFTVNRGEDGFMTEIVAEATFDKKPASAEH